MQFDINITGLDALAASISDLAEALKAGVTANEVIAKASNRKPRTPAPVAPAAVEVETKTYPDGTQATGTAPLPEQSPAAETPPVAPEPSTPAAPSEPAADKAPPIAAAHEAEAAAFNVAAQDGKPTIAQVRAAIGALAKTDKDRALAILTKHGAASVSALKEDSYVAVMAEASK